MDLKWKEKSDDQRRESSNHVRHFHVGYWAMPLSLFAIAYVFLLAARLRYQSDPLASFRIDVPANVGRILGLLAILSWLWFLVLQVRGWHRMVWVKRRQSCRWHLVYCRCTSTCLATWLRALHSAAVELVSMPALCASAHSTHRVQVTRLAIFPRKVWKEWTCPVRGPAFAFATMCLLILASGIMLDKGATDGGWRKVAKALFWAAAPLQLVLSSYAVGHWVFFLHDWEHLAPTWLAVPLTNVFAAIAWAQIYRKTGTGVLTASTLCIPALPFCLSNAAVLY